MNKFQKFFNQLADSNFVLKGSTLVIEVIEEEVTTSSGIVIAESMDHKRNSMSENRINVGRVLMVGEGYMDDDGNPVPCDVQVGAYILLPKYSTQYVSVFPGLNAPTQNKIGLVKEGEILAYYPTEEDYNKAKGYDVTPD